MAGHGADRFRDVAFDSRQQPFEGGRVERIGIGMSGARQDALPQQDQPEQESYYRTGAVNHFGILVDDLDATERKILDAGYRTHSHQTYDPGSRFYFHDHDDIEWEVVSYA